MAIIHTHLHFNGNAEEAFEFYRSIFGGSFTQLLRYRDLPDLGRSFPENEWNKIMRISLPVGGSGALMGSDVPDFLGKVSEMENRSKIVVHAESKEDANDKFNKLSMGGTIEYPMGESPWGTYFGALRDKYGIEWMVEFTDG